MKSTSKVLRSSSKFGFVAVGAIVIGLNLDVVAVANVRFHCAMILPPESWALPSIVGRKGGS